MEQSDLLRDLVVIYLTAAAVVFVFQWAKLPAIVGLLVAGVIVGPYGLSLVDDVERVELLADIGIVLLLFTIGMEFTRDRLTGVWRLMGAGLGQVALSIVGVTALLLLGKTESWGQAVFGGFLVAHTSTTVLLKILMDRGEGASPHARISLGISIVQDLSVVWMIVFIPALAGRQADWQVLAWTLILGSAVVAGILLTARFLLPGVMFQVVRMQNRELFMIVIALVCLGTAWLTSLAGLSLALGAFLAGVALAESEYSHQTLAEAIPFRDVFVSLFFISIGMLFDAQFFVRHPWGVLGIVAGVLVLKFFAAAIPTLLLGYSWRVAVMVGVGMAQIGEFAFVLSRPGREAGLLPDEAYQALLAAAVVTMGLSPFLLAACPRLIEWADRWPWLDRWFGGRGSQAAQPAHNENHAVVVGYGVNGRNLAWALRKAAVPYVVLELNPVRFRQAHSAGEPAAFGDSTRRTVLENVGVARAKLLVVAISDPTSTRRTVQAARRLNHSLHIVVRSRYLNEVEELQELGADEIIPEEFETSIEILSRVLHQFAVPHDVVRDLIGDIREDHYRLFRGIGLSLLDYEQSDDAQPKSFDASDDGKK
jgi:monovalent cation:H+ antiporter-2, CPA2 family